MSDAPNLCDPAFLARLDSLALLARKVLGGRLRSDRPSPKRGAGIAFADYSEYRIGDDYRSIDWRVYARSGELVTKLFEIEEDITIHLVLDRSPSMARKLPHAQRLAAALAYIALCGLDRVAIHGLADHLSVIQTPCQGRGKLMSLLRSLGQITVSGVDSDLETCVTELAGRHRRRGLIVLLSDFLLPRGIERGLDRLQHSGHDVFCLQIQDAIDREAPGLGDLELHCVETGQTRRLTVTEALASRYTQVVTQWNDKIATACKMRGIGLTSVTTEESCFDIVERLLRRGGLVA